MTETHESNQTLWLLVAAPVTWAGHFLLSYITVSIWCAKMVGSAPLSARALIGIYTVVALVGIGFVFLVGYRRHTHDGATGPTDRDTPEARHRFLGIATLLLAGLSAVATIYVALAAVFIATCY